MINIPAGFHFYRTSKFYRAGDVFSVILTILHLAVTITSLTQGTKAKTLYGKVQAAALGAEAVCIGKRKHVVHITSEICYMQITLNQAAELKMFKPAW